MWRKCKTGLMIPVIRNFFLQSGPDVTSPLSNMYTELRHKNLYNLLNLQNGVLWLEATREADPSRRCPRHYMVWVVTLTALYVVSGHFNGTIWCEWSL
jgi:hypothetical protein